MTWKAIKWLHKSKGAEEHWDQAISRPPADYCLGDFSEGSLGGMSGMSQREQEQLFSTHAPRQVRKAMKKRRKAREQAQKDGSA